MDNKEIENIVKMVVKEVRKRLAEKDTPDLSGVSRKKIYVISTHNVQSVTCQSDLMTKLHKYYDVSVVTNLELSVACSKESAKEKSGFLLPEDAQLSTNDYVLFPALTKSNLTKAALCIADNFETLWMEYCLSHGIPIMVHKDGLPTITENMKRDYATTLMSYERKIQSYGVKFVQTDELIRMQEKITIQKNVITLEEVLSLRKYDELEITNKTIFTAAAKEEVKNRNIRIVYK